MLMSDDYGRVLETAMREFERGVERHVDREFERALKAMAAGDTCEIPFIGGEWPPPEYRDGLKERVIRALCARHWFRFEAPIWAGELPLTQKDCNRMINQPDRRRSLVGAYGDYLRTHHWHYQQVYTFEIFTAYRVSPPA
jgi:hypothetical protein